MSVVNTPVFPKLKKAVIKEKNQISSHFYHLKMYSEELRNLDYIPGQHLKGYVDFDEPVQLEDRIVNSNYQPIVNYLRSYSIWRYNPKESTFDLAINALSDGPGASWIKKVQAHDNMYFFGYKASFIIDYSYENYYFIGDTTSLAHLYSISRALPSDKNIQSMIYDDSKNKFFLDLEPANEFNFTEIKDINIDQIIKQISLLNFEKGKKSIVYIAGEGRACQAVSKYFQDELNWDREDMRVKRFWVADR